MARYEVHDFGEGKTEMPAKVIERAIERRLLVLPGVRKVRTALVGDEAKVKVIAGRGEHSDDLHDLIDEALGVGFWIDLGMADITYSVIIEGEKDRRS